MIQRPAMTSHVAGTRATPVLSVLYLMVAGLCMLRIALNAILLQQVMDYTGDQGSIVEKLHPTLWGFFAVTFLALALVRIDLTAWETRVLRAMMAFLAGIAAIIAFITLSGRSSSIAFVIDNYVASCFAALLFLFRPPARRAVGKALLIFLLISTIVAVVEFTLEVRLLPYAESETAFRPVGLASHPLEFGMWCAVAIPVVTLTDWSRRIQVAACAVFLAGLVVSGARTALLCGTVSALVIAVAAVGPTVFPQRRLERRLALLIAAALALPFAAVALFAAGALQRFQGGVADGNAEARVIIYRVFDYLSWLDILLGIGMPRLTHIATDRLGLPYVESAIVIFVAMFGAIGATIFVALFARLVIVLLQGARPAAILATILFFTVALSNNALAAKEPTIFVLLCFLIAFRPAPAGAVMPGRSAINAAAPHEDRFGGPSRSGA